jgi:hypothetical protein
MTHILFKDCPARQQFPTTRCSSSNVVSRISFNISVHFEPSPDTMSGDASPPMKIKFLDPSSLLCRSISITDLLPDAAKVEAQCSGPLRGYLDLPTSRICRTIGIGNRLHKVRENQGPWWFEEWWNRYPDAASPAVYRVDHGFE